MREMVNSSPAGIHNAPPKAHGRAPVLGESLVAAGLGLWIFLADGNVAARRSVRRRRSAARSEPFGSQGTEQRTARKAEARSRATNHGEGRIARRSRAIACQARPDHAAK